MKHLIALTVCGLLYTCACKAQTEEEQIRMAEEMRLADSTAYAEDLMAARAEMAKEAEPGSRIAVRIVINPKGKVVSTKVLRKESVINDDSHIAKAEQRARALVYEAITTTKNDERTVYITIGNSNRVYH